eukprot:10199126-Lingulodinium_polyedra.AAC.1
MRSGARRGNTSMFPRGGATGVSVAVRQRTAASARSQRWVPTRGGRVAVFRGRPVGHAEAPGRRGRYGPVCAAKWFCSRGVGLGATMRR